MEKFLESAAKYYLKNYQHSIENTCLVFPNRRSGAFFTAYLQQQLKQTVIGPEIVSIDQFISGFSEKQKTERLQLITLLYDVFAQHFETVETFDDFYFWGEVLLSDFDEIDKYLVDGKSIFKNVVHLKEIDFEFQFMDESQLEVLKQFWGSLDKSDQFKSKEAFLKIWQILWPVYTAFKVKLEEKGIAYNGMLYREVAENLAFDNKLELPFSTYFFVGLNALNECEKKIFLHLQKLNKAVFLWDYDQQYMDDPKNLAGYFLRQNIQLFPSPEEFEPETNCLIQPKKINVIAVPSSVGQAQVIPDSIAINYNNKFDNTAIVLADESLLYPVLGAIPNTIGSVNVTMGYPVVNSAVFGFISLLISLVKNARFEKGKQPKFYYKFVFDVLNHQLLSGFEKEKVLGFMREARKKNQIYFVSGELFFSDVHRILFEIPEAVNDFGTYFLNVLKGLYSFLEIPLDSKSILTELLVSVYAAIEQLQISIIDLEESSKHKISPAIFFKLMNQYMNQVTVPYEGEPLTGLQVMGVLETRCLDFENLIILGLNEDMWPKAKSTPSFIPHNLRVAFGLPLIDNHDAMYAYYFYRLIQKAENITITYNTVKDGLGTGELSRYGFQLIYDSNQNVQEKVIDYKFKSRKQIILEGKIPGNVTDFLKARYSPERPLSPSALNLYLSCNYRFYLRYIVGLPEKDTIKEEIDGQLFGTVFHSVIEKLYSLNTSGEITVEWINAVISNKKLIEDIINEAFAKDYFNDEELDSKDVVLEGSLVLIFENIKTYIKQLLLVDRQIAPFEMVSVEKKYTGTIDFLLANEPFKIDIGGFIDRLDLVGGRLRVIDYKTGNVNTMVVNEVEELFDTEKDKPLKEAFQALYYSYILKKFYYPDSDIASGIYGLRSLFDLTYNPYFKFGSGQTAEELLVEFEKHLKVLLEEIFAPENVFRQTEHVKHCEYCPYNKICHKG